MEKKDNTYRVIAAYLAETVRDARRSRAQRRQPAANLRDRRRRARPNALSA